MSYVWSFLNESGMKVWVWGELARQDGGAGRRWAHCVDVLLVKATHEEDDVFTHTIYQLHVHTTYILPQDSDELVARDELTRSESLQHPLENKQQHKQQEILQNDPIKHYMIAIVLTHVT